MRGITEPIYPNDPRSAKRASLFSLLSPEKGLKLKTMRSNRLVLRKESQNSLMDHDRSIRLQVSLQRDTWILRYKNRR